MRNNGLSHCKTHFCHHPRPSAATRVGKSCARVQELFDGVRFSLRRQGKQIVKVGKNKQMILDVRRGALRQLLPAIADTYASLLKPPEHVCGICNVEIFVRRLGTDLAIVNFQNTVELVQSEMKQALVPP